MAYDYNQLTSIAISPQQKDRYGKVKNALQHKLGKKKRTQLRKEYKGMNKRFNPVDSTTGLAERTVDRQARQETRAKYSGAEERISSAIRASEQRTADIAPAMDQYRAHLTGLSASQTAAADKVKQDLLAQAGTMQNQDADAQGKLAERAQGNPQAEGALQAAQDASSGRKRLAENSAAAVAERGAIRASTFGGLGAISRDSQQRITAESTAATSKAKKDHANLLQEIGDYFNTRRSDIKSAAGDALLKQAVSQLQNQKFAVDTADKEHDNNLADLLGESTINNTAADNARADAEAAKPDKKKSKYTPSDRVTYRDKTSGAMQDAQGQTVSRKVTDRKSKYYGQTIRYIKIPGTEKDNTKLIALTPENREEVKTGLRRNGVTEPTLLRAATTQLISGFVSQKMWDAVRATGVNPKSIGLKLKAKAPKVTAKQLVGIPKGQ